MNQLNNQTHFFHRRSEDDKRVQRRAEEDVRRLPDVAQLPGALSPQQGLSVHPQGGVQVPSRPQFLRPTTGDQGKSLPRRLAHAATEQRETQALWRHLDGNEDDTVGGERRQSAVPLGRERHRDTDVPILYAETKGLLDTL